MIAFGAAILMAGVGISLAALGMAQFVKAFNGMPAESIYAVAVAIGFFMAGMVFMVSIMASVAPVAFGAAAGFIPLGIAIALIGVGVLAAAFGMSLLVTSLVKGFDVVSENLGGFLVFVGGLTALSLLSPGLFLTFGVLVPGLGLMALALWTIDPNKLQALGALFQGISGITNETATAMKDVATSISSILTLLD